MVVSSATSVFRFGVFEVDAVTGELRKSGGPLHLQPQPSLVLLALLRHAGQMVSREELRLSIWPDDTFVEFDDGLNHAIRKLRETLGDSAQSPTFIETIPRRGYRFVAPVQDREAQAPDSVLSRVASAETPPVISTHARRWRGIWVVVALAAAVSVAAGIFFRQRLLERFRPVKIESIAVLPLANLSGDPSQEYFSDGMTEALITELGKVRSLRVISRQSMMHYRKTNKPLPEIARELNVDAVVEGSAMRSGDKVRITTQLVQANPERHLWSQSYERKMSDVIGLQREVAETIIIEIRASLTPAEQQHLRKATRVSPDAYEDYLRGRYIFERGPINLDQAISYLQQAVRKDPSYAPAYAWLAHCYVISGLYHPPQEFLPKAREAALKALEIDDTQAAAHAALGWVNAAYDWDWYGAERELRRAIELESSSSAVRWQYVWYLSVMGRFNDAIAEARSAKRLDPLSLRTTRSLGWAYLHARRYDEAIDQFQKALELEPDYPVAQLYLANCYLLKGMYPEALALLQKLRPQLRPQSDALLAYLYGVTGRRSEALKVIADMKRLPYIDPFFLVIAYAGVGDRDNAIRLLNKGYAERSPQMPFLKVEPFLDPLRSDPRFQELVSRMNYPQ